MELFAATLGPRGRRNFRKASKQEVLEVAAHYQNSALVGTDVLANPNAARKFLCGVYGAFEHEVFGVLYLDNRHRVVQHEVLFRGTLDGASVFPREVIKRVLDVNAAAVVFFHNHPSGIVEPSQADELITTRLRDALSMIDVRTLDHVIVARDKSCSFAERGLL